MVSFIKSTLKNTLQSKFQLSTILTNINRDKLNVEENIARAYYQSAVLKLEGYTN
jgi:hypothetical protein